jgi:hypothetical protein
LFLQICVDINKLYSMYVFPLKEILPNFNEKNNIANVDAVANKWISRRQVFPRFYNFKQNW